jgi:hypothetical protein
MLQSRGIQAFFSRMSFKTLFLCLTFMLTYGYSQSIAFPSESRPKIDISPAAEYFDGSTISKQDLMLQTCLNPNIEGALKKTQSFFERNDALFLNCTGFTNLDPKVKEAVSTCTALGAIGADYYWCPLCIQGSYSNSKCRVKMRPEKNYEQKCNLCESIVNQAALNYKAGAQLFNILMVVTALIFLYGI